MLPPQYPHHYFLAEQYLTFHTTALSLALKVIFAASGSLLHRPARFRVHCGCPLLSCPLINPPQWQQMSVRSNRQLDHEGMLIQITYNIWSSIKDSKV